tara:strand:- start:20 stop:499 length:480 start_codon:yes stop_codon:yes gene_type:complete
MSFTKEKDNDNYITTEKSWNIIIPYLPKDKVIWEPFYCDGKSGKYLKSKGFNVIHEDKDFFKFTPECDLIVSNPPFSKKKEIFDRLKKLDKPFMMIAPSMLLGYKYFQDNFANNIQIIIPDQRLNFIPMGEIKNYSPPFSSLIYCYKMNLKKDLIFIKK